MPKAKKLPSGSWRTRVYSHSIPVLDPAGQPVYGKDGKPKEKKIYESFTAETKKESELMAAEFAAGRRQKEHALDYTLGEAIDAYIALKEPVLSPTTVDGYRRIRQNSFQCIMNMKIKKITETDLQQAINTELSRDARRRAGSTGRVSTKTVKNAFGLVSAALGKYRQGFHYSVTFPAPEQRTPQLATPDKIFQVVKGTPIELPVLLAMWLSLSLSEIRGLTKSKSILDGKYLRVKDVIVDVGSDHVRKAMPKAQRRNRYLEVPPYIMNLIAQVPGDVIVPMTGQAIYSRWRRLLKKNNIPHMTFHDLRHVNASVMAMLNIPEKYALERGGWKTPSVMKNIYQSTFEAGRTQADAIMDTYFEQALGIQREKNMT